MQVRLVCVACALICPNALSMRPLFIIEIERIDSVFGGLMNHGALGQGQPPE